MLHVSIRRNSDALTRVYDFAYEGMKPWDEDSDWIWSEGNYSCDCNRAIFFERAAGKEHTREEMEAWPCGDESYTITAITQDEDPTVLYEEVPPTTSQDKQ
jgi:hypothetical protein